MKLKQSVVIVNEFSVPQPGNGKASKGSRGGTPGEYVTRYMARDLATESLAPIRRNRTDDFIERYMARQSATESLDIRSTGSLKTKMSEAQGDGGVAFGYGEVSLSHEQLHAASADIQRLFDSGHTVMKTVLSFDQEYLRKHKLIPEDFVCERRGDYRGHVDQMKMRLAIMHGLERMGRSLYDDLRYVAVIQVDTEHVHCHLAMVDAGAGTLAADGTQKGKISSRARSFLRRGIDSWLDEKQTVRHLTSAVGYERRNVTTFVKRWAHQQMLRESLPQFLLATLPADRRLWRLSTNDPVMRKPNRIVRDMVQEVLSREGSPMAQARAEVQAYADHRRESEGLSRAEWRKLVDTGVNRVIERGVNAVYALLRQLPADALRVRTPMLEVMGLDYEEHARRAQEHGDEEANLIGFGFRMRSFASRLEHHTKQRSHFHEQARAWERADDRGQATAASRAVYEFYLEEEAFNARVASKYRHFLAFPPPTATWYQGWSAVSEYGERLISLESMRRDQSLRKMKDEDEAERLGQEIYGQAGGRYVCRGGEEAGEILADRVARMRATYAGMIDDLRVDLAGKGLTLELTGDPATGRDTATVNAGAEHDFEEVKGLDLHHMSYDFSRNVPVGPKTLAAFLVATERRAASVEAAASYLIASGQSEELDQLPLADVKRMVRIAAEIRNSPDKVLRSQVADLPQVKTAQRRSSTFSIGDEQVENLTENLVEHVERSVFAERLYEVPETVETTPQEGLR